MKTYILVKTNYDWADEMDIEGFCVIEQSQLTKMKNEISKHLKSNKKSNDELTVGVGTNQELGFNCPDDVFKNAYSTRYEEIILSADEYTAMSKLFTDYRGIIEYGGCSLIRIYEHIRMSTDDDYEFKYE